jgi:ribonuclease HII
MHKICGIDEAGRGPLAGELVVSGVVLEGEVKGLMDSKKLSAKRREELYEQIIKNSKYHIVIISAEDIDTLGMSKCLHNALVEIQQNLSGYRYIFDGNSKFGVEGIETLIKADDKIPEVSAASILAKVTRDRLMIEYAKSYPEYGFDRHKGYATKAHYEALHKHNRCPIHRKSFFIKGLDGLFS